MKVTISDIARLANVSKTTVSRVINNKPEGVGQETKNKICRIIEEYEFQPSMIARGLVTKKTKSLGLIIPDITNPFFPQLVRGVEDFANKSGYHLFLCNSDRSIDKEKGYINAFVEKSVDGVILTSNISETSLHHRVLKQHHIPFVLLDRYVDGSVYDSGVFLDNVKGAYLAVKYLLDNGHENIAFISGPMSVTTSKNRLKGYKIALNEKNLEVNQDIIKEGDYLVGSGFSRTIELLEQGKEFTAVFAGNDMMAFGAMKALKSRNIKIPDDVEVIGFDNIELSQFVEPPLTTVAQPAYDMGFMGAKQLIKLIEGKKLRTKNVFLEPELILRGTTKSK